jgi:hypothetical protein
LLPCRAWLRRRVGSLRFAPVDARCLPQYAQWSVLNAAGRAAVEAYRRRHAAAVRGGAWRDERFIVYRCMGMHGLGNGALQAA